MEMPLSALSAFQSVKLRISKEEKKSSWFQIKQRSSKAFDLSSHSSPAGLDSEKRVINFGHLHGLKHPTWKHDFD